MGGRAGRCEAPLSAVGYAPFFTNRHRAIARLRNVIGQYWAS